MDFEKCPFEVGSVVIYRPSGKGRGAIIMTDLSRLAPGQKYKIAKIEDGIYIIPEGFETAIGGGLYWTEFSSE
jgi:hypothetical protein